MLEVERSLDRCAEDPFSHVSMIRFCFGFSLVFIVLTDFVIPCACV